jgi:hypothetical protein
MLNRGNTRMINFGHWRINLKPHLPEYPTRVVTKGVYLETCVQSTERRDINTLRKLLPISGLVDSNSRFQNSKGINNYTEFLDRVLAVEEVFELNGVPEEQRVSLVVHTF